jgi:predicted Co/Zn/Cd cation transporter (cation efflux family)
VTGKYPQLVKSRQQQQQQQHDANDEGPVPVLAHITENATMTVSDQLTRLEKTVDKIIQKFKYLDHHFEHAMVGKTEKIGNLLLKVNEQTETIEQKLQRLEKNIKKILTTGNIIITAAATIITIIIIIRN